MFGTKPDVYTAFVHVPKEKRKALDDRSQEFNLIEYGSENIYRLLTKKTRKFILAKDVKFDGTLLEFGNLRSKAEPLCIYDDAEDKKDAQAPTEDVKEPTGKKSTLKKANEVQSLLRRSFQLHHQERCQARRRGKERVQGR